MLALFKVFFMLSVVVAFTLTLVIFGKVTLFECGATVLLLWLGSLIPTPTIEKQ